MPRELPRPAGAAEIPEADAKAEPELAENKAILRARRKKGEHVRWKDVPAPAGKLTAEAKERRAEGLPPHMDPENPELWDGSICGDD